MKLCTRSGSKLVLWKSIIDRAQDRYTLSTGSVKHVPFDYYSYIPKIWLRGKFWSPRNICPYCYILDNGDSYSRLPATLIILWLIFHGILVLVLLPILINYFNGSARAPSFDIAAEIKIMGEPPLVFIGLQFGIYLLLLLVCTRMCHEGRKNLKTSKI
jgi:hypothetical protein